MFIVCLPVLTFKTLPPEEAPPLGPIDFAGLVVYTFGFTFEIIADEQRRAFREEQERRKQESKMGAKEGCEFIHTGLWSLSRHPNYFGEITLWLGVYLLCWTGFKTVWQCIGGFCSPLLTALLLIGVLGIPILERTLHCGCGLWRGWSSEDDVE